jgi:hypothetical protein
MRSWVQPSPAKKPYYTVKVIQEVSRCKLGNHQVYGGKKKVYEE